MKQNPEITIDQLSEEIGISSRGIKKQILRLKEKGHIERIGPDKRVYWKVTTTQKNK
jgi:ATP-dependent DNA helicase RecG